HRPAAVADDRRRRDELQLGVGDRQRPAAAGGEAVGAVPQRLGFSAMRVSSWLARCSALFAAALLLACNGGGGGGSPTDPGGTISLALTATPTSIAAGGRAQIVAQVTATGGAAR